MEEHIDPSQIKDLTDLGNIKQWIS